MQDLRYFPLEANIVVFLLRYIRLRAWVTSRVTTESQTFSIGSIRSKWETPASIQVPVAFTHWNEKKRDLLTSLGSWSPLWQSWGCPIPSRRTEPSTERERCVPDPARSPRTGPRSSACDLENNDANCLVKNQFPNLSPVIFKPQLRSWFRASRRWI